MSRTIMKHISNLWESQISAGWRRKFICSMWCPRRATAALGWRHISQRNRNSLLRMESVPSLRWDAVRISRLVVFLWDPILCSTFCSNVKTLGHSFVYIFRVLSAEDIVLEPWCIAPKVLAFQLVITDPFFFFFFFFFFSFFFFRPVTWFSDQFHAFCWHL